MDVIEGKEVIKVKKEAKAQKEDVEEEEHQKVDGIGHLKFTIMFVKSLDIISWSIIIMMITK